MTSKKKTPCIFTFRSIVPVSLTLLQAITKLEAEKKEAEAEVSLCRSQVSSSSSSRIPPSHYTSLLSSSPFLPFSPFSSLVLALLPLLFFLLSTLPSSWTSLECWTGRSSRSRSASSA